MEKKRSSPLISCSRTFSYGDHGYRLLPSDFPILEGLGDSSNHLFCIPCLSVRLPCRDIALGNPATQSLMMEHTLFCAR